MAADVIRSFAASTLLAPQVAVVIAVDTAWIAAQGSSGKISQGIFMIDNMVRNGSSGEGTLHLHTKCNAGSLIGFEAMPINCIICNISANGAKLTVGTHDVPDEFMLVFKRRCRVVRRTEGQVGVKFVQA